jgi:hypothetical protein
MSTPTSVTIAGGTGLTGSATLLSLLSSKQPYDLRTLTRRALPDPSLSASSADSSSTTKPSAVPGHGNAQTVYHNIVVPTLLDLADEASTGTQLDGAWMPGGVLVSCLGTTRAKAGGLANQKKVDVDLGLELGRRAKAGGVQRVSLLPACDRVAVAVRSTLLEEFIRTPDLYCTVPTHHTR